MDSSAGGAHVGVTLHQVHQLDDGLGLEVDVAVQGQQVRVLSSHLDNMKLDIVFNFSLVNYLSM